MSHLEPDHSGNIERFLKKIPGYNCIVCECKKHLQCFRSLLILDVPEDKRFVAAKKEQPLALG